MGKPSDIKALTALRGVAAWWVVLYHFREVAPGVQGQILGNIADRGYLAVDLFFIMSGFVIALNYGKSLSSVNWTQYRIFIWARIARIYPLHLFIMILYLSNPILIQIFSAKKILGQRYDIGYYILSLFLVQNWGFTENVAWNIPAWSISTEFFAYLAFPLLWMAASKLAQHRMLEIGTVLILIALATLGYFFLGELGGCIAKLGLVRCVFEFSLGLLLFFLVRETRFPSSNQALAILIPVTIIGLLLNLPDYLVAPAAFMLLIAALLHNKGIGAQFLNRTPLVWLGEISFSTYLIHFLIRDWVKFTLLRPGVSTSLAFGAYVSATLVVSPVLYYAVERPGRRFLRAMMPSAPGRPTKMAAPNTLMEPNEAPSTQV